MQEGQATLKDKKIQIKQVKGVTPITLASFECAGSCVCALCRGALAQGSACSPVCPASESFFCFQNKAGGFASKGVVHVFHEWCLQDYFSENSQKCPACSPPVRIGIDIGGVIIKKASEGDEDTSFFRGDYLKNPSEPRSFEVIGKLVQKYGSEHVFLVSKAGASIKQKTVEWLRHKDFFLQTSFKNENIYFCEERKDKASIASTLKLTHFIDDTLAVLTHLVDVVPNLYLYDAAPLLKQNHYMFFLPQIHKIRDNWAQLEDIFITKDV